MFGLMSQMLGSRVLLPLGHRPSGKVRTSRAARTDDPSRRRNRKGREFGSAVVWLLFAVAAALGRLERSRLAALLGLELPDRHPAARGRVVVVEPEAADEERQPLEGDQLPARAAPKCPW